MRLAVITTHPIQYYAPIFKLLAGRIDLKVFYTWGDGAQQKFDPGFGKTVTWDIPLLEGYDYDWVKNTAPDPGSHHFKGIINPGLTNQIEAWQADAILVYGWAYDSHLKAIRHFKNKIPVYFRGDSTLLDVKTGAKQLLRSFFLRWVYSHVDHALYVGSNNCAYFKKYGLKGRQLSFAPHAIDNDRFAAERTEEASKIRSGLGIKPGDVLILFAGKFEEKKSPLLLLNAFLTLNMPNTHLLFVGNGILEGALKTAAGKNNHIHFISFQNQLAMPALYQACNLFCLPSQGPGETWGLAVNEAMAAGKPVLVSDKCGCAADLVNPGVTGEVFETGDISSLTKKLCWLVEDKNRLTILGHNAAAEITNWSFSKQADAMLSVINNTHAN
ncbi:glycosyltransferase family 4 protein [Mucilaginibacter ginsenosidivorax]|uniref:Glycosyltransferase family 4 protein n=1 Tax=Mucilaginibacter ginsenosidivorax TaxID=862126 RepID=A0A5B8W310_9SPHI|nr:glycosyltransferase family 4 protein [Mucilaginibacter ginsenosidivorax]QEC77909.1 glycosyltransferase family 4 protein [Mucilaginibacter ginsenosidivorax]